MSTMRVFNVVEKLKRSKIDFYKTRDLDTISRLVIHHSQVHKAQVESIARYHVDNNKWPGIGYHLVINMTGEVYLTNWFKTISYHTKNHNQASISLCFNTDLNTQHLPPHVFESSAKLAAALYYRMGLIDITAHKFLHKTDCPGTNFPWDAWLSRTLLWVDHYMQFGIPQIDLI
jgi:hypothetical protein